MSRETLTIFLCAGKECRKVWRRLHDGSPSKWLKRRAEDENLPYRLRVIKTECMDHCDHAACMCAVADGHAFLKTDIHSTEDARDVLRSLPR